MPTFTRDQVLRLVALRGAQPEGVGDGAFMEFRVQVTPEVLAQVMGATIRFADGHTARIASISVEHGYAELVFEAAPDA